jgi:hypothetical protein
MCSALFAGSVLTVYGVYALIKGEMNLFRRQITGIPARILAILFILPALFWVFSFLSGR